MLPGLRFLFATTVLALSVLVFGLGAAALLRAAHEEFVSLPSWRLAQQPLLAPQFEMNAPSLAMMRMDTPAPKSLTETARPQQAPVEAMRHDILRYESLRQDNLRPATVSLQAMHAEPAGAPDPKQSAEPAARTDDAPQDQTAPAAAVPLADTTANLDTRTPVETPAVETPAPQAASTTAPAESNSSDNGTAATRAVETSRVDTGPTETKSADPKQPDSKQVDVRLTEPKPLETKPFETEASDTTAPETISPEIRSSEATATEPIPLPAIRRASRPNARAIARRRAAAIARAERTRTIEQQRLQKNAFPLFNGG